MSRLFVTLCLVVPLFAGGPAVGQDAPVATLASLQSMARTAKTAKDYTHLVDACKQKMESDADAANEGVPKLLAWALCRRGESRLDLASSLRGAGNREQFSAVLDAAMVDFNDSIDADDSRWKTFFSRGVAFAAQDENAAAIRDLEQAVKLNPKSRNARFNLAELRNWSGDHAAAIINYQEVLKNSPDDVQAINGLGHAQTSAGKFDDAKETYTLLVKLQSQNSKAWVVRGQIYERTKDWKGASENYEMSLNLGKSADGLFAIAWLLSTCPNPDFFQPQAAAVYAKEGMRFDDQSVRAMEVMAASLAANGEFAEAASWQEKAIANATGETADTNIRHDADAMKQRLESYQDEEVWLQAAE